MWCPRLRIDHLFRIPMIRCHDQNVPGLFARLEYGLDRPIRVGDGLDGGFILSRVSNHVGRSKVAHDELVFLRSDDFRHLVRHFQSGHLRLEVVRRHLGTVDQEPIFLFELPLDAAVKEKGDMGVLLGLWEDMSVVGKGVLEGRASSPAMCICFIPFFESHSARTSVIP